MKIRRRRIGQEFECCIQSFRGPNRRGCEHDPAPFRTRELKEKSGCDHYLAVIPIEKDAVDGPLPIEILARVAAQMGEPDRAIAALQKLLSIPYEGPLAVNVLLTPALLRLDPMFDPLRNDPRFQKLCEEKPK